MLVTGLSLVFFTLSGVIVFFTRTLRRRRSDQVPLNEALQPAE